jgi:WD40 repeat protein
VTFSPDGMRIAAVGYEGIIYLWDTATGQALLTLRGPLTQLPNGVACDGQVLFSPDGTRLAANCWNGTVYVWEANSQLQ